MVRADGAFRMGRTHLVCQDYVVAQGGEQARVLLADGCSSSPHTDVGARLLTLSALPLVPCLIADETHNAVDEDEAAAFGERLEAYHQAGVIAAKAHTQALGLPDEALDATLLTLAACEGRWFASVFGDGVIAAARDDGALEVTIVAYPNGYPYYPNYLADLPRKHTLLKMRDSLRQIEKFTILPDGVVQDTCRETCPVDAPCPYVAGRTDAYRYVAALSDGVHSFTQAGGERAGSPSPNVPVALNDILRELTAFKTTTGQFAQRRMQRFVQTSMAAGWRHHDDISLGVLAFG